MMHAARLLLREKTGIIGLRFDNGLFALFRFWRGFKISYVIFLDVSPVSAIVLYISTICLCMVLGVYFISSSGILPHSELFHFGYYFLDFICSERNCHLGWWYGWKFVWKWFYRKFFKNITQLSFFAMLDWQSDRLFLLYAVFGEVLTFFDFFYSFLQFVVIILYVCMVFLTFSFSSALIMMWMVA